MEFIIDETEVEDFYSSDESDSNNESDSLSDYSDYEENDESFYRSFDNREEFHKVKNQIKNPAEEHQRQTSDNYGEDDLPEMFSPEDRDHVEFGNSECTKERANNFKKTLQRFDDKSIENHFFYSVVYGLMFQKQKIDHLILIRLKKFYDKIFIWLLKRLSQMSCWITLFLVFLNDVP